MLVSLGRREHADDVVDLLRECHGRIRRFLVIARELATARAPAAEIAGVAAQVRRYFEESFPLHIEDEEQDIAPRLASAATAKMCAEHALHARAVAELVTACRDVERDPAQLASVPLVAIVDRVARELEAHLEQEERDIFPALRRLPVREREAMREAMRARRERAMASSSRQPGP